VNNARPPSTLRRIGIGVCIHVGLIFTGSGCKAGKVFFHKNRKLLAVIESLLTIDRHLLGCRPCENNGFRQSHSDLIVRIKGSRIYAGRTAFEGIAEISATRESSIRHHYAAIAHCVDFSTGQAQSNGIIFDTNLHGRLFLITGPSLKQNFVSPVN